MKKHVRAWVALFLFVGLPSAWAQEIPEFSSPVVDELELLSPQEKEQVAHLLVALLRTADISMAVYITQSLQGLTIEDFSIKVAEKWKLGGKQTERGLLFVIAPRDRKLRLEVGYGLEGSIPDLAARRILDEHVVPYFKNSQFADGITEAITVIASKVGKNLVRPRQYRPHIPIGAGRLPIVVLLVLFWIFVSILRRMAGTGHGMWSSRGGSRFPRSLGGGSFGGGWGGGGGGFTGGGGFSGGGGFGGGGSSSSW